MSKWEKIGFAVVATLYVLPEAVMLVGMTVFDMPYGWWNTFGL